jgi:hypothetical protein
MEKTKWSGAFALEGKLVSMPSGAIGLKQRDGTLKWVGNEARLIDGRQVRIVISTLDDPQPR